MTAVQVRDVITRRPDHADLQDGRLQGPLGYTSFGGIIPWVPLFMFVLLFGLSMDYHVFILSRIRELHSRGASTRDALVGGISSSAGVVTSAAVIMVAVFSILATLPIVDTKTLGVGLAAAVLIDATVVRGILLPAAMSLRCCAGSRHKHVRKPSRLTPYQVRLRQNPGGSPALKLQLGMALVTRAIRWAASRS